MSIHRALRKILVAIAAVVPLASQSVAHAATLDEIKARGYMVVATEDDFAPFEFVKDGKGQGFDYDMLEELRKYAPFKIRQEVLPWTGILPGVTQGKYDAAITGCSITVDRMASLSFTQPWALATHYSITRAGAANAKTLAQLSGLTVGVQTGSAQLSRLPELGQMLKKTGGSVGKIVQYPSYPEIYADLANGRLDYVVNTLIGANTLVRERPNVFQVGVQVAGQGYYAYPVMKGNDSVLEFLTGFVEHLRQTGRLAELQKKWFGQSFNDLPSGSITTADQVRRLTAVPN
ncbi:transporter substrate-binding domain-containing protein [Paraburkholderia tropica]|uniref:transporter substrate-binding domain-containing protein n=1 Tax=Paraburkholderia tropica TaxID=92647 RepID=UPI0007ED5E96|nr:transporter substrate-binding domain-containing protein [Paraburkholderia tropica]OBR46284.1 amino acid ABC transporter substrate-binding protein [Paraburkholderia tropica]